MARSTTAPGDMAQSSSTTGDMALSSTSGDMAMSSMPPGDMTPPGPDMLACFAVAHTCGLRAWNAAGNAPECCTDYCWYTPRVFGGDPECCVPPGGACTGAGDCCSNPSDSTNPPLCYASVSGGPTTCHWQ